MIVASALILGVVVLHNVQRSIEPELAARTHLIGTLIGDNVQRAVAAGVPLDKLVGAEAYFGNMLHRLPEVAYVAVATGGIVLEAGERVDPYLAPPRERKGVRSHPIFHEGEEIAYVIIDIDPAFISERFVDVFLDMAVVILVAILAAFEVMVLLNSRSLTSGLDRFQRLAAMQAAGDFFPNGLRRPHAERWPVSQGSWVERSELLHAKFASAMAATRDGSAGNEGSPDLATIPLRMAELRARGVKWLYMGSSNFLLLNADLLTSTAVDYGVAVLSPYEALVRESQALLSIAAKFEDVGELAADQALKILRDGEKPISLPIVRATDFAYVVNMDVAESLDLFPPFAFLQVAETVRHN